MAKKLKETDGRMDGHANGQTAPSASIVLHFAAKNWKNKYIKAVRLTTAGRQSNVRYTVFVLTVVLNLTPILSVNFTVKVLKVSSTGVPGSGPQKTVGTRLRITG